jgi:hypothetical protein
MTLDTSQPSRISRSIKSRHNAKAAARLAGLQLASLSNGGRRFAMYDQVLVSVFLGAACLVVYLEFLRETAVPEKVKRPARGG